MRGMLAVLKTKAISGVDSYLNLVILFLDGLGRLLVGQSAEEFSHLREEEKR